MAGFWDFWNNLTGQSQEDQRTQQTNEANLESVKDTNQANRDIATETNQTNERIAQENLKYQRELQEYNKALQQQIFEREDTSYQRTAQDMINAGLNPLTMQGTNGAGEAIAQSPLNNQFQAQIGAPMQAAQFIKSQTLNAPIKALETFTNLIGTGIGSIESVLNGSVQRDALRSQSDSNRLRMFLDNIDKGVVYNADTGKLDLDESVFNKYLEQKAKEKDYNIAKMNNDMREWEHMENAKKYYSDNKYEQIITAVEDWLVNGRGADAWNRLVDKYPILKIFSGNAYDYAKSYGNMTEEEKQEWSKNVNEVTKKAVEENPVLKSSSNSKSQYR